MWTVATLSHRFGGFFVCGHWRRTGNRSALSCLWYTPRDGFASFPSSHLYSIEALFELGEPTLLGVRLSAVPIVNAASLEQLLNKAPLHSHPALIAYRVKWRCYTPSSSRVEASLASHGQLANRLPVWRICVYLFRLVQLRWPVTAATRGIDRPCSNSQLVPSWRRS